jgi:hypothetical protein
VNVDAHTLIGEVDSVKGNIVTVALTDLPNIVMVDGQSYRVGQVGGFVRIPVGYTQLFAVCTYVSASPIVDQEDEQHSQEGAPPHRQKGRKFLQVALFGEAIGNRFERGISQYPTIGDRVHLVTQSDMRIIYGSVQEERSVTIGHIAAASGIKGALDLGRLVNRHSAIVGSTGSGKSNLVAVLLEAIATQEYPSARVLVIDPHGEYATALGEHAYVFKLKPDVSKGEQSLHVPFWALPFDELRTIALGDMQPGSEAAIRDEVAKRKQDASRHVRQPPSNTIVTADSPIPFSLRKLWFDLDKYENQTFNQRGGVDPCLPTEEGDAEDLLAARFPPAALGAAAPYLNPSPRNIRKQLDLCRSRIMDSRYSFLLKPGLYDPDLDGKCKEDLDVLVSRWVGHDRPVTVLDVSGVPSAILPAIVGTLIRIVYDMLFWGRDLAVGGRKQPLLVVLEEAHLFLPEGQDSPAHRAVARVAKEGRKYGVGMCVVSQRPTEVDSSVLSQCGTMIALRLSNTQDKGRVESTMPDDIGALAAMLPALRTGEGIVVGEAMPIPSRIRFFRAGRKPEGDDPDMPGAWKQPRPDRALYAHALDNWRHQTDVPREEENNG